MARTPGAIRRSPAGEAPHVRDKLGIPQEPRILRRAPLEQAGVTCLWGLIEQSSIRLALNLTAVRPTSQHAKDNVRRHPVLLLASSVHRIAAPPQAGRIPARRLETANP